MSISKERLLSAEFIEDIFLEEDPTLRQENINKFREIARKHKCIKAYDDMIKAQKMAIKEERKRQEESAKENPLQPISNTYTVETGENSIDTYQTGRWKVTEDGIVTNEGKSIAIASYYPVIITRLFTDMNTNGEKLELAWKKNGVIRTMTAVRNMLSSKNKIVELSTYGFPVTTETSGNMVKYLSEFEVMNNIESSNCSSKFGWAGDIFIPYTDDVVFDGSPNVQTLSDSVGQGGDYETWLTLARQIRSSGRREPVVCLAASFGSVLLKPLNLLPFILNLYGSTGSGKTVTLMLASSIWANPSEGGYISESNSTINALEMKLDVLNHLPLMVDDLSKLRSDEKTRLMDIIYGLCSGRGKGRLNRNGEIRHTPTWCNVIVTNMERPLSDDMMRGGAINRTLDFEVDKGDIYPDGNGVVSILTENYGFAGPAFIDAIKEIGIERIRATVKKFRERIKDYAFQMGNELEEKQVTPLAVILTADVISEEYIFKDGIHIDFEYAVMAAKSKRQVSEMERAYKHFIDAYHINKARFNDDEDNFGEVWGKKQEGDFIAVIPSALDKIATLYNFNKSQFIKWCKENGFLQCDSERNTMKVSFNGTTGRTRCYVIKLDDTASEGLVIRGEKDTGPDEPLPFEYPTE